MDSDHSDDIVLTETARIARGLDSDLVGVLAAWLQKGPPDEPSYSGARVAAFDKLSGALLGYGLAPTEICLGYASVSAESGASSLLGSAPGAAAAIFGYHCSKTSVIWRACFSLETLNDDCLR
jgi:hypothetical protein